MRRDPALTLDRPSCDGAAVSAPLRRGSHRRITVHCALRAAPKCRITWTIEERLANESRARNDGRVICEFCSRVTKSTGRNNPNTRYPDVDDRLFERVENEAKAYLLGWIASDGAIRRGTISIYMHEKDAGTLRILRDVVCASLPLKRKKGTNLVGFAVSSVRIVADACRWLGIGPGKKDALVQFPELHDEQLRWAFLRGFFDGDGAVSSIDAARRRRGWPAPRCSIASTSTRMLDAVQAFTAIPAYRGKGALEWNGANALDLLGRLYDRATIYLPRKRDLYLDWCTWVPAGRLAAGRGSHPLFRWARTSSDAVAPYKRAASDSGFDLTLIGHGNKHGAVEFFRTGIRIDPAFGWYFDLVPRSSISKTGYMLANSIGVIDRAYVGEIIVPLVKIDPAAPDLELPARVVQIVPRQVIAAQLVEVDELGDTLRGANGFGSSGR